MDAEHEKTRTALTALGLAKFFPGFPVLSGIATNAWRTFSHWPLSHDQRLHFGPGQSDALDQDNLNIANALGASCFIRLAPGQGNDITVVNLPYRYDQYSAADSLVYIEDLPNHFERPALLCPTADTPVMVIHGETQKKRVAAIINCHAKSAENGLIFRSVEVICKALSVDCERLRVGLWPGLCAECQRQRSSNNPLIEIRDIDKSLLLAHLRSIGISYETIGIISECSSHSFNSYAQFHFCSCAREKSDYSSRVNIVFIA